VSRLPNRRPVAQRGSTLIEVLVSILLFSVGIIALMRTLAVAMQDSGDIEYRAVASTIADERVGRMWIDRGNLAGYAESNTAISQLPDGKRTVAVNGNIVTVTVTWKPPAALLARTHQVTATITGN
jgi:type IV pilus assembly protein PilV